MIEDTSKRAPELFLLAALSGEQGRYITDMEADGQRQLVASQQIPIRGSEDLAGMGFALGPVTDDLFRAATLPVGWTKRGSDHAMWSHILDEHGRERVAIFYKAAFYDRAAFCRVTTVSSYVWSVAEGRAALVLDDTWATADAVCDAAEERAEAEEADALRWQKRIDESRSDPDYIQCRDEAAKRAVKLRAIAAEVSR